MEKGWSMSGGSRNASTLGLLVILSAVASKLIALPVYDRVIQQLNHLIYVSAGVQINFRRFGCSPGL